MKIVWLLFAVLAVISWMFVIVMKWTALDLADGFAFGVTLAVLINCLCKELIWFFEARTKAKSSAS